MDATGNITTPAPGSKSAQPLDAKGKARLQKAVKDFEAIFLGMMMKSMRTTVPKDEASGESFGNDAMESLFDAEVAKKMAGRSNLGLAEMLYRSITKESLNAPDPVSGGDPKPPVSTFPGSALALKMAPGAGAASPALQSDPEERQGALPDAPSIAPVPQPVPLQRSSRARVITVAHPEAPAPKAVEQNAAAPKPAKKAWPAAPSASTLERIASYENIIQDAAAQHGVDSTMLKAVIAAESAGHRNAVSPRDAKGLMQLTDSTAADMGVRNVWNPRDNIQGGARYLQSLIQRFPGDTTSVIASYNAGPARVGKHGGVPPIPETQAYVRRVMNYMNYFEQEEASHERR